MTTFTDAVQTQETTTTNGMKALKTTTNKNVDLFFKIGASRNKDIIPDFVAAFVENSELAVRIALHARDIRQGSGERKVFRSILQYLENNDQETALAVLRKIPELGRWDDIFTFTNPRMKEASYTMLKEALLSGNALAAKWTPREKHVNKFLSDSQMETVRVYEQSFDTYTYDETATEARKEGYNGILTGVTKKALVDFMVRNKKFKLMGESSRKAYSLPRELRKFFGWTPKFYRKTLSDLTSVVETQMCANDWDNINFSHVPSVASNNYRQAFNRHTPNFAKYVESLVKGDPEVKVNAGAIFPYNILSDIWANSGNLSETELNHIVAQWEALPNYVGTANVLPLVDVSGSMETTVSPGLSALKVAVSLGLYLADKNQGEFKDTFLTFSSTPELLHLKGNIVQKMSQMRESEWGMSTNLEAALDAILHVAKKANVSDDDMPKMLLILSDMQFNACVRSSDQSAIEMMRTKYQNSGYSMPSIVFWNLTAASNVPVTATEGGVALVSGFSTPIVKSLLDSDMSEFTPEGIMLRTVMVDRYNF